MMTTATQSETGNESGKADDIAVTRVKIDELLMLLKDWDPAKQRDCGWKSRLKELVEVYRHGIEAKAAEPGWHPDIVLIEKARRFIDKPVFICGYMKSGTTLLTQMLDGHPQSHVLMAEISFMTMPLDGGMDDLKEGLRKLWFYRMIVSATPSWYYEEDDAYVAFVRYFLYFSARAVDHKMILEALVMALYCANPRRSESVAFWAVKNLVHQIPAEDILKMFPMARFVHPVRAPFPNLAALKRQAVKRGWEWSLRGYALTLRDMIKEAYKNEKKFGKERYHLFYYDKLVDNPEEEVRRLAGFLGIDWSQSLLTPTGNSRPATSNSMYKEKKVTGTILSLPGDQWRSQLTKKEFMAAAAILYPVLVSNGVPCHASFRDFVKGLPGHIRFRVGSVTGQMRKILRKGEVSG